MDYTWREFFKAVNTKEYHSQRETKANETADKLNVLGDIKEIGSTSKALAIHRPDFDYLLIFPEEPYFWDFEESPITDDIIDYMNHAKYFRKIENVLGNGIVDYPSFVYTSTASIR
ncbi:hypothetical protein HK103_002905, partial [Boothiomyces macroporosus]